MSDDGTQGVLNVFPFFQGDFLAGLRIFVDQEQEGDAPDGTDGSEDVKNGRPASGGNRQESTQRHRYDGSELGT